MANQNQFAPDGWPCLVPRIAVDDAAGLVAFIQSVFDAGGAYNADRPSELQIGDSILMVGNTIRRASHTAFLYVYVPRVDDTYQQAVKLGAKTIEKPTDMPYGDRRCMFTDKWGISWQVATRLPE